jgi:hypothetical protein
MGKAGECPVFFKKQIDFDIELLKKSNIKYMQMMLAKSKNR